jgi:hypothetical protein
MNSLIKSLFICSGLSVFLTISVKADVTVYAQVDTSKDIYVGESFGYYIVIEGADKAGQADLAPLAKYNPQSTGNRQQSSTQIINNQVTTSQTIIMTYSLVCNQVGRIQLPPVTVTIDGKNYQTDPMEVNILKPGTTDQLELEVTLSERQCYVGQPIILNVKFYRYANIGDYQFDIPVLDSGDFYVEEPEDKAYQAKQDRITRDGREAILHTFSKILIPRHVGEIEIKPASISAEVVVGHSRSRDSFFDDFFGSSKEYKRFMVSSKPLNLKVLPLPEEGKPSGFYGLVGRYTISASAAPTKVSVGDPITLTIKVGGDKYLKPVQWPALEQIAGLADNFKIPAEKASPVIEEGYKVFTQTIRAENDNVTEIPPIPLAYFDADKGRYETAKTEPIKLDVSPTKILTSADLEGLDFAPVNTEVEAIKKGLSANYEGPDALMNQTFSPLVAAVSIPYLLIWSGPLTLLIISVMFKFLTYTTPEKVALKRRRAAAGKAVSQLKTIFSYSAGQRCEILASIMKQYIGDRFDKIAGSLTSDDCSEIVFAETRDSQSAEKFREIIASCEAARYASTENNLEAPKIEETVELIKTIEKKSRK